MQQHYGGFTLVKYQFHPITDTILVEDHFIPKQILPENTAIYCRVSNQSRKDELNYQVKRCEDFCIAKGWAITKTYKEIASGMNDNRKQFWKMLESQPTRIVVENKDRLTRFGFNYLERLLKKLDCELVVINTSDSDEQDLIKDLVSVITSFCCRIYGLRRAQSKITRIKNIIKND
jgi:putative resolvase